MIDRSCHDFQLDHLDLDDLNFSMNDLDDGGAVDEDEGEEDLHLGGEGFSSSQPVPFQFVCGPSGHYPPIINSSLCALDIPLVAQPAGGAGLPGGGVAQTSRDEPLAWAMIPEDQWQNLPPQYMEMGCGTPSLLEAFEREEFHVFAVGGSRSRILPSKGASLQSMGRVGRRARMWVGEVHHPAQTCPRSRKMREVEMMNLRLPPMEPHGHRDFGRMRKRRVVSTYRHRCIQHGPKSVTRMSCAPCARAFGGTPDTPMLSRESEK